MKGNGVWHTLKDKRVPVSIQFTDRISVYKLAVTDFLTEDKMKQFEIGLKQFVWYGTKLKFKLETLYKEHILGG